MLVKLSGLPAHLSYTTFQVLQFVLTIQALWSNRTVGEAIRFKRSLGLTKDITVLYNSCV